MSATAPPPLKSTLATTIALGEQFISSLSPNTAHEIPEASSETPSPLLLLHAAATSLKSQVTKLSLLTVTAPFTPTAVATCLQPLNESILPSLITATLLTTPESYTPSFSNECKTLTRRMLRELLALLRLVKIRYEDNKPKSEPSGAAKKELTEATGRVWEGCDDTTRFSDEDLPGFVVRQSRQWLDLMKDAVKELQEWDPEEEVDDGDLFGDVGSDSGSDEEIEARKGDGDTDGRATISAGVKDQALKVLSRIPQSVHVVLKQRLEKIRKPPSGNLPMKQRSLLDQVLSKTRNVSELIDESAEGMYMGDLELCLKKAGEARSMTIEIVEAVLKPWDDCDKESKEDQYIKRALDWIQQVEAEGCKTKVLS